LFIQAKRKSITGIRKRSRAALPKSQPNRHLRTQRVDVALNVKNVMPPVLSVHSISPITQPYEKRKRDLDDSLEIDGMNVP